MKDKIAKKSESAFGEPYRVRKNKVHEFFYCSKCLKDRRTNPIYYADSNPNRLFCAECYSHMLTARIRDAQKNAEDLPEGTTLYVGKKEHKCVPEGPGEFEEKAYRLSDGKGGFYTVCLLRCKKCGELIVRGNKYNLGLYVKYNVVSSKKKAIEDKRTQTDVERKIRYTAPSSKTIAVSEFLTRVTLNKCSGEGHIIEDIQVAVKVLHKDYSVTVEIVPALFCRTCHKYYLLESIYQELKATGILLCNVVEQSYWSSSKKNEFFITNQESLLHKMGYNVSANNSLLMSERHAILRAALDNGLLTKAEILSHLDYLIRRSRNQTALSAAVEKWKDDREYVRGLSKNATGVYYEAKKIVHRSRKKV